MGTKLKGKKVPFKIEDNGEKVFFSAPSSFVSSKELEEVLEEVVERREALNPSFQKSLKESLASGKSIPWEEAKNKLGLNTD